MLQKLFLILAALSVLIMRPSAVLPSPSIGQSGPELSLVLKAPDRLSLSASRSQEELSSITVVIENKSSATLRLWSETCSWGYQNLSFEIADSNGKVFHVTRSERGWEKNFPQWDNVAPGASISKSVNLLDGQWRGLPSLQPGAHEAVRLQAFYKSSSSYESTANTIWVGSIVSDTSKVNIMF
jgi:hypothetical protein